MVKDSCWRVQLSLAKNLCSLVEDFYVPTLIGRS